MFGLRDKLRGDIGGIAFVAGDNNLRRPGEHVDRAVEGDQFLGGGDVEISRANDLIDAGDGLRSIGQERQWPVRRRRGKTL